MPILIHPTRATRDIPYIGVRKGERMFHVLSDLIGPPGARELRRFVRGCGMRPEWVQYAATYREHFDAHAHLADCLMQRGARLADNHEVGALLRAKRAAASQPSGVAPSTAPDPAPNDASEARAEHEGFTQRRDVVWGTVPGVPDESELGVLGEVAGRDVLELGCGDAADAVALALRHARCVGLDASARLLERARRRMDLAGVDFPLIRGDPQSLDTLGDASFDIVFNAHGALSAVPDLRRCLRAVARVLRPGGICAFAVMSPFFAIFPASGDDQLRPARSYFDRAPLDQGAGSSSGDGDDPPRFHRTVGDWIAAFVSAGLTVTDVLELEPHPRLWRPGASHDPPWAKVAMLPSTTIWRARKLAPANAGH
ncbi:MAG TPA: class I SAM-dependent methyltransferase [Ktedonobacterales bacterium]